MPRASVVFGRSSLAFVGLFFFGLPYPLVIGSAAVIGSGVAGPEKKKKKKKKRGRAGSAVSGFVAAATDDLGHPLLSGRCSHVPRLPGRRSLVDRPPPSGSPLWWAPVLLLRPSGWAPVTCSNCEGIFFGQTAMVTFGGAYAVLAYVAQRAVEAFHWLRTTPARCSTASGWPKRRRPVRSSRSFSSSVSLGAWRNPGPR